ncbi:hypothetical protein [Tumebacillus permanentifrigoris]|uniref:Uncharacterized protein n=1 Tax=Tumebacillus permanentifrigoris TaxID=378543 RepID=A0A316D7M4_9BACL|nr:hypothetical protein [Tumebacillus permanentifrigoris]PWK12729.1 hypothetical protein C7459_10981 [Tumebacillus permanentifrigoris]
MDKSAVREMVVQKVSKELYLDEQFVIDVMNAMEAELGDELYGQDTIAEVVARILDIMDDTDENWESDKSDLAERGVKKVNH